MTKKQFGMVYFDNFSNEDMIWGLISLGREVEIIDSGLNRASASEESKVALANMLKSKCIDVALSHDFSPALSDACMSLGIIYICWVFDAPIQMLYDKQVLNDCNYIFTFDKVQYRQLKDKGCAHTYYMPLATNLLRNLAIKITDEDVQKLTCDISFIGTLYAENEFEKANEHLSEATISEMEEIMRESFGIWDGKDRLYGRLSQKSLDEIRAVYGNSTSMDDDALYTTAFMVKYLAKLERIEMLTRLSGYGIRFYTRDRDAQITGVDVRGGLEYTQELPKAYHLSHINMNITMRGITSGVPLRVFDIMGMGGFALTNFQPEIPELFTPGKDIEVYHSFEEMEEKASFYLNNEKARQRIAINGAETIKKRYTVEKQVAKMLQIVGQGI